MNVASAWIHIIPDIVADDVAPKLNDGVVEAVIADDVPAPKLNDGVMEAVVADCSWDLRHISSVSGSFP